MAPSDEEALLTGQLRRMQIILAALLAGALIWGVVAFAIRQGGGLHNPAPPIISCILSTLVVMELISLVFFTTALVKNTRRKIAKNQWPPGKPRQLTPSVQEQQTMQVINTPAVLQAAYNGSDTAKLLMLYALRLIVAGAALEGATFGLIIGWIVDATWWTLIAALVFLVLNTLQFPTRPRVERWLDQQQELLQQERVAM